MKLLDYDGLGRLVNNIKSYISAKLEPIEDVSPYVLPGITSVMGDMTSGNVADDDLWLAQEANNMFLTLRETTATTDAKKEVLNRFLKGLPGILYVKLLTHTSRTVPKAYIPLFPVGSYNGSSLIDDVIYRTKDNWFGNNQYMQITVRRNASQVQIKYELYKPEIEPVYSEFEAQLPCPLLVQSIAAAGTVVNPGTKSLSALTDENSVTLYNRLQKGMPPSFIVDMELSDGSIRKVYCYLKQITANGNTYVYESGSLANGTFTNKYIQIMATPTTYRIATKILDVTTT